MIATLSFILALLLATGHPVSLLTPNTSAFIIEDNDYKQGRKALIERDYQKAIESFLRYAAKKPNESDAHYYLGLSYRGAKRYDDAIRCFEQAWTLDQRYSFAPYELGKTYLETKNYEAAMEKYRWLQENKPPFGLYLRDQFPQEMLEQYQLQPSLPFYQPKKADSLSQNEQKPAAQHEAGEKSPLTTILPATISSGLRPKVRYAERAKYTEIARHNLIQGTVILSVVYSNDGVIKDIRVIRALPDGLVRNAIEAAQKIRFSPAVKDGQPVSVRGNVEFNFTLY